jgi:hypothetical protein
MMISTVTIDGRHNRVHFLKTLGPDLAAVRAEKKKEEIHADGRPSPDPQRCSLLVKSNNEQLVTSLGGKRSGDASPVPLESRN